jgi:NADPH-dependent ferric siderophore reductase
MARTNVETLQAEPETSGLMTLRVVRREEISPSFARVTLGGGDIERFTPLGFDQWFRIFIPVTDESSLTRLPQKLNTLSYAKFLTITKTRRPVLRNYTVRAFRGEGQSGPELDVDFVLHGDAASGTAGPAASWAATCSPGDAVAILDEGIGFFPPADTRSVLLVADETALPAVAGILTSLPRDSTGLALVEIPHSSDAQAIAAPPGVELRYVVRQDAHATPGRAVVKAASAEPAPGPDCFTWASGESSLATDMRRHWVAAGVPKQHIAFSGYWKAGKAH